MTSVSLRLGPPIVERPEVPLPRYDIPWSAGTACRILGTKINLVEFFFLKFAIMAVCGPTYNSGTKYFIYTIGYAESESDVGFSIEQRLKEIKIKEDK